jgi:hypothetical protein
MEREALDFSREYDAATYSSTDLPKYPARTLCAHIAMKGAQLGSVIGLVSVLPYSYFRSKPLLTAWKVTMPAGFALGMLISGGRLYRLHYQGKLDVAGVDDRAYRISKNLDQTKVDQYSFVGALAGASCGVLLSRGSLTVTNAALWSGFSLGMAVYQAEKIMNSQEKKI